MITIPEHVITVSPEASARLLEKVWACRVRMSPQARTFNKRLKAHLKLVDVPALLRDQAE